MAVSAGVNAQYVLIDSWFICEALLKSVPALERVAIRVAGLCKLSRSKYQAHGKEFNASQLIAKYERTQIKYR